MLWLLRFQSKENLNFLASIYGIDSGKSTGREDSLQAGRAANGSEFPPPKSNNGVAGRRKK
jgi:hypothetical protein